MARWVLLADPGAYGWEELVSDGATVWDGIRNRTAQGRLAEARAGDEALLYHTAPDKAIVGVVRVVTDPYPDPSAEDRVVVDVEPVTALDRPLTLDEVKGDDRLAGMGFVRMPRVAVHRVEEAEWDRVMELTGTDLSTAEGDDPTGAGGP
ncbi:MAG: EVE domain-containing protein [Gemmatimonadetes bacterium]|nr:EVE domain-containing protein [Gemmatimonadota bacterium]NIQ59590.1 EVE domain-containing protein [Gemmatimonadota bacterium]NIU79796.1 EVE domain-containing protein [Gammaproteobacteria bacterium]NIX48300.1 EVE domain-containing protein [Gemmatimonadota bacterium]NIY12745.1 EVE domain-containing protein [Gemmatimonadota bacterium]